MIIQEASSKIPDLRQHNRVGIRKKKYDLKTTTQLHLANCTLLLKTTFQEY